MAKAKGAIVHQDTIYKTIPVYTETTVYDTIVKHENHYDTLFIDNVKWSLKIKYDTILKNQYVQVKCKGDTIYKEVPVSVPISVYAKDNKSIIILLTSLLLLLLLIIFVLMKK
jgi:hypothetical protein